MKQFLQNNAYSLAGFLILLGALLFWGTHPSSGKPIPLNQSKTSEQTFQEIFNKLEVFGFADTLASAKTALKKSLKIFQAGDYALSIQKLDSLLGIHPDYQEAQYYLGMSYLYENQSIKAFQILNQLSTDDDFPYREDAEWFAFLSTAELDPASTKKVLQKISSQLGHKYQTAASALLASISIQSGAISFQRSAAHNNEFAIAVQPARAWWQNNLFRYSYLFVLPLGGIGLIFWKNRNEAIIKEKVALETAHIQAEKEAIHQKQLASDQLLKNMLPEDTAEDLKKHGHSQTKRHEEVSVLFCDFQGFTKISEELAPEELVHFLGLIFEQFDRIIESKNLEKIKTVGDCYICAGGLKGQAKEQAIASIEAAREMLQFLQHFNQSQLQKNKPIFNSRIGINTGSLVAGVVGVKKYAYDIWGDTVNIAARMEANAEVGRVNISEETYRQVKYNFDCEYRGKIEAKNKGYIDMYYVKQPVANVVGTV